MPEKTRTSLFAVRRRGFPGEGLCHLPVPETGTGKRDRLFPLLTGCQEVCLGRREALPAFRGPESSNSPGGPHSFPRCPFRGALLPDGRSYLTACPTHPFNAYARAYARDILITARR